MWTFLALIFTSPGRVVSIRVLCINFADCFLWTFCVKCWQWKLRITVIKNISNESVIINNSVHIMNSHSIGIINPCNDKLTKQLNDGYKWITISFLDFFLSNTLRCVCVWTYISHFGVYLHGWLVLFQGSDHLLVKLVPSLMWKMLKWKQLSYKPHCKWFFQATRWWYVRSGHTTRKWTLISLVTLIALLFADF